MAYGLVWRGISGGATLAPRRMQPAVPARRLVQFGVFELDLDTAELRKQGVKVKLQDQPCKVLRILLEKPGQIVTRDELRARVWPANTFVEFDQGLYSAMARLRDALGDSSESPRFIETLARRGYRFVAPTSASVPPTERHPLPRPDLRLEPSTSQPDPGIRRFLISILAGLLGGALVLAVILGLNIAGARQRLLRYSNRPIRSIAVLPLENLSGDSAQDYFADGMTDELITDLAQLANLRVISRTSVMHYKKNQKTLPEIGRELDVDAIVEGTVARSGNRVRIRVQLIRARDDQHLWARAYEREISDILLLQSDAAHEIAEQVGISVAKSGESQTRRGHARSIEPNAYETYLKGRYLARTRKRDDVEKAGTYFREAIQQDPEAALAYAGLADVYLFEFYQGTPRKESVSKARYAASKALEIDPDLAEPHITMAGIAEAFDWNWPEAENHYKRALELEPSSPSAHLQHGVFLVGMGRFAEAIPEIQLAERLDPLSANTHAASAFAYFFAGQYDRSIEQSQKALEIDPAVVTAHANLINSYMGKRMYDQAVHEFEKFAPMREFPPESVTAIKQAYQRSGIKGFWQEHLDLNALGRIPKLNNFEMADYYALVGERNKALTYLEKSCEDRDPMMEFLHVVPEFRDLHSEPRFQELLRRVGLPH